MRNFQILIFSFVVVNQVFSYWLGTCIKGDCETTLQACHFCFGERGCKSCISTLKSECSDCANDIYNKSDFDLIGDKSCLVCDSRDPLQVNVCHLFCRGQYAESGKCQLFQNIPACQCYTNEQSSSTTSITSNRVSTTTFATPKSNLSLNLLSRFNTSYPGQDPTAQDTDAIFGLPNGDLVRSYRQRLQIWDTDKGVFKRNITDLYNHVSVFGLLSTGDLVAGYRMPLINRINIWDLNETKPEPLKRTIETTEKQIIWCLTVLKNDDLAMAIHFDLTLSSKTFDIEIRDSFDGIVKKRLHGHSSNVNQIIELPNDSLASCSNDKTVKIWDLSNGTLIRDILHSSSVNSMALLKNGDLASGLNDGIQIWNIKSGTLIRTLINPGIWWPICNINCLHVLSNGYLLGGSNYNGKIQIWNPYNGTLILSQDTKEPISRMTLLSNGKLVTGSRYEFLIWSGLEDLSKLT